MSQVTAAPSTPSAQPSITLAVLRAAGLPELERYFAAGRAPADLGVLEGAPRGYVLAAPALSRGMAARTWQRFVASRLMLWQGKSFEAGPRGVTGRGGNRVWLAGRRTLFPFSTALAPSMVDGLPCIAIDYAVPANGRVARQCYDELREVGPGLFLGRGTMRLRGRRRLAVWFAVDATAFDKPIALPRR